MRTSLPRVAAAVALVAVIALLLGRWDALQRSDWWYPETDAYQLWVAVLTALAVASFVRVARSGAGVRALSGGWLAALGLSLSGMVALVRYVRGERTPGDLLQGYLAGARRVRSGAAEIYDLQGLQQSVNASPVALLAFLPLAGLNDDKAIAAQLAISVALLLGAVVAAAGYLRARWDAAGVEAVGLFACGLVTFFTFQRSWRLGQIDTWIVALLLLGWWRLAARPQLRGDVLLSAVSVVLAAALKVGPAVTVLPVVQRALSPARDSDGQDLRRRARRWLAAAALWAAVLSLAALAVVGPRGCWRFVENLGRISAAGTTSGNNYALAARLATWGDRDRRGAHFELSGSERWLARGLGATALLLLLWLGSRLRRQPTEVLMALWLAALPLLTPICWDIYLLWCSYLPWLVLWAALGRAWRGGDRSADTRLLGVLCGGSYLLSATAGNTVTRDLRSGIRGQLELPAWLDEVPLCGHLLMLATLVLTALREERRLASPDPDRR